MKSLAHGLGEGRCTGESQIAANRFPKRVDIDGVSVQAEPGMVNSPEIGRASARYPDWRPLKYEHDSPESRSRLPSGTWQRLSAMSRGGNGR